ncbi:Pex29p [Lachancea thermotolerans CBS 6340]|uniref:KLTH0E02112p n=1 Tax=Lachancea thermotolerans (strain ATCC 56472 / CBS 6340 / NRRL Y-8284) TaxID=559295 RepID=C5DH83_LACTC|nr:KLTH0E02112p [Lachancea thermotolerans CBS 6340]CAR23144.1 KLTH0E02112p [Lachancea thermotolerans CBS 6340]
MDSVAGFFWDDAATKRRRSSHNDPADGAKPSLSNERKGSVGSLQGQGGVGSVSQNYLADKLVEKLIYMALPPSSELAKKTIEHRVEASRNRPGLSVPIMSRNFVQLNSRLGPPFQVIDEVIKIFNWTNTAYTLSVLSLFTYTVMKPLPTLTSIPIFYLLFGVMVPQYLKIHKPDSSLVFASNPVPATGPPLVKAEVPKPVPEFSKEFILNLTDLQNHMLLYVSAFDFVNGILARFAFFTDESTSSAAFLALLVLAWFNALFMDTLSRFIPLKSLLIISGWALALALHPRYRDHFLSKIYSEETRLRALMISSKVEKRVNEYFQYREPRELRQASIFEVQKLDTSIKTWGLVGYSTDHYALFSDYRISEKGLEDASHTLEEVKAPLEWEWTKGSKWVQDLDPVSWVASEFVDYVDIDVEAKWVYDACLDGSRGDYRRRRWIRQCTRIAEQISVSENTSSDTTDDVYQQGQFNGYASSFAPETVSGSTGVPKLQKDQPVAASSIPKSNSVGSASSVGSKTTASESGKASSSKAAKSLTDLLNLT